MAATKSGWYTETLLYALAASANAQTGTPTTVGLTGNDANMKISLYSSSSADGSAPLTFGSSTPAWTNAVEVTGTGWTTGGPTIASAVGASATTLAQFGSSPYGLQYSWSTSLSVASTTLSNVYGCVIYFQSITAPVSKPMLLSLCFGTAYATVAGTFGITPSGSGLSQLTLTQ